MEITLRRLDSEELADTWSDAFMKENIERPEPYFAYCLNENRMGHRVTLLAFKDDQLVGCAHLKFESGYEYFKNSNIPEINDLNVFPRHRRQGVANRLLEEFEQIASMDYKTIGIGVGLYKDYGPAQRIYCRRGYIPDGNGVMYNNKEVVPGTMVRADDDLNLYFVKDLRQEG
ncbi:GNAT family N-acetyltransferase [Paenibacillus nasutitermitis]|uniref:N-acetyltransferase n=1 Tax=Paenibacillus nasutitermitis TaxID=1652958 RepID=A0A916YYS6_9BACL|nr:GNAT family N-acetyltransferase [Paenibacillus nasutitermitis]GGD67033.1 N-acetyltransferase [Paenibacillus nasutitermitis]